MLSIAEVVKVHNEKAQPRWAEGTTFIRGNIDTDAEQGKTVAPIVGCSGGYTALSLLSHLMVSGYLLLAKSQKPSRVVVENIPLLLRAQKRRLLDHCQRSLDHSRPHHLV